jgi:hypothetical protein
MYDADEVGRLAEHHGFTRRGKRNWLRRTPDFVQLVNFQVSRWSPDENYLNFALWPLALGEPPATAESKFLFRIRAEDLGATSEATFFARIRGRFETLDQLRTALASGPLNGMVDRELRDLLAASS